MKLTFVVTAVLAFPLMVSAQSNVTPTPRASTPAGVKAPDFPFPSSLLPAAGLFEEFWNDPACIAELHLTDAQRKQLKDASLAQRLSLIDSGADALKAFTRLSTLLDEDQIDEATYKQQLEALAAATGKVVVDLGEMTVSPRRVLTLEQWQKLKIYKRAKRAAAASALATPPSHQPAAHKLPESLQAPLR